MIVKFKGDVYVMYNVLVVDLISNEGFVLLFEVFYVNFMWKKVEEVENDLYMYDVFLVWSVMMVIEDLLVKMLNLKIVVCVGVGVDNIDIEVLIKWGVVVINVLNGNIILMVEYIFVMMVSLFWYIF